MLLVQPKGRRNSGPEKTPDEQLWLVFLASRLILLVVRLLGKPHGAGLTHGDPALRWCEVFRAADRAPFLNCPSRSLNSFLAVQTRVLFSTCVLKSPDLV